MTHFIELWSTIYSIFLGVLKIFKDQLWLRGQIKLNFLLKIFFKMLLNESKKLEFLRDI